MPHFFFLPVALTGTFNAKLNRNGVSRYLFLVPILGKIIQFFTVKFGVNLLVLQLLFGVNLKVLQLLLKVEKVRFHCWVAESFYHEWMLNFVRCIFFFISRYYHVIFFLPQPVYMVDYIGDFFLNIELALHPWNMILFRGCWILFANVLLRSFTFIFMSDTHLYFLFLYCLCSCNAFLILN